ncbi:hypothetical protein D3C83_222800 [compost metagenome]
MSAARRGEIAELAIVKVDQPVAEEDRLVGGVGLRRVALDDENAEEAAAQLL